MTVHARLLRQLTGVLLGALVATGCSLGSGDPPLGGAERLPQGDPPDGTVYAEPVDDRPGAPAFSLELLDGEQVDSDELWEDRPGVIYFFASWCTLCQRQQAEISEVAREYGDRVVFLGVAGDDTFEDVEAYLREHRVPYAVGLDPDLVVWLRYGVVEPPLVAFVSRGGQLVRGDPGGLTGDEIRAHIEELLLDS